MRTFSLLSILHLLSYTNTQIPSQLIEASMNITHHINTSIVPYANQCIKTGFNPFFNIDGSYYYYITIIYIALHLAICCILSFKMGNEFKNGQLSYPFYLLFLYWQVVLAYLLMNIMQCGDKIQRTEGIILLYAIAIMTIWSLSLQKNQNVSKMEKCLATIFHAVVIYSFVTDGINLAIRIVIISYIFSPILQQCYYETHKQIKSLSFTIKYSFIINILFFVFIWIAFPGYTLDPWIVQSHHIFSMIANYVNIAFSSQEILVFAFKNMVYFFKKKYRQYQKRGLLKKGLPVEPQDSCLICLSQLDTYMPIYEVNSVMDILFANRDALVKTQCNHMYHSKCLRMWIRQKETCPIDNRQIPYINRT